MTKDPSPWTQFLMDWQTLIAGVLALVAAGIGFYFINRQILQAEQHEGDRIERSFDAARATFPLVLSDLAAYARETADFYSVPFRSTATSAGVSRKHFAVEEDELLSAPAMPDETVPDIRRFIEACPDKEARNYLSKLIRELQILRARMESMVEDLNHRSASTMVHVRANLEAGLIKSALIHAYCENFFEFARGETSEVPEPPSASEINSSLNKLGFWGTIGDEIRATVERRYGDSGAGSGDSI